LAARPAANMLPFSIKAKSFVETANISEIMSMVDTSSTSHSWKYKTESACSCSYHCCDGLIFTPAEHEYFSYIALKWKPLQFLSVDFAVDKERLLECILTRNFGVSLAACCKKNHQLQEICQVMFLDDCDFAVFENFYAEARTGRVGSNVVIECVFDLQKGVWRPFRLRQDKLNPNSVDTAWSTLQSIAAPVTVVDLLSMKDL
jgi:hypothetical protein